jgi:hypothetical protein
MTQMAQINITKVTKIPKVTHVFLAFSIGQPAEISMVFVRVALVPSASSVSSAALVKSASCVSR